MSDKNQDEKRLSEYLDGKSELSRIYTQTRADAPDARTDARILAEARHATTRTQKPVTLRRHQWAMPVAMAAMLLVGISLLWWQIRETPEITKGMQSSAPTRDTAFPRQVEKDLQEYPTADAWLESILKLHQAGNQSQAAAEFKRFRQLYPDYRLDDERYKALQAYDN